MRFLILQLHYVFHMDHLVTIQKVIDHKQINIVQYQVTIYQQQKNNLFPA
jgi:hypothetical protein